MGLNEQAAELCDQMARQAARLKVAVRTTGCGTRVIDCGIEARGGLEAGLRLAEICMAGLGTTTLVPADQALGPALAVMVTTDHPVAACMAAQYAGWQIAAGKYFAMGSGPMRAAIAKEEIFKVIGCQESTQAAVGVLETRKFPPDEVCEQLANQSGVASKNLTLLVAPTASQAGTMQIVARSVETALHKLFELGFDLSRIESAAGTAPLPPVAADDLAAIGRTNDAILYGAAVTLWVRGDDASLDEIGPQVPSSASADHGEPFAAIFERYGSDFYKIDPLLFSPAVVTLANLDTGRCVRYGKLLPSVLREWVVNSG